MQSHSNWRRQTGSENVTGVFIALGKILVPLACAKEETRKILYSIVAIRVLNPRINDMLRTSAVQNKYSWLL